MFFCWLGKKVFFLIREGSICILFYFELELILYVNYVVKFGELDEFIFKGYIVLCLMIELLFIGKYFVIGGGDVIMFLFEI